MIPLSWWTLLVLACFVVNCLAGSLFGTILTGVCFIASLVMDRTRL